MIRTWTGFYVRDELGLEIDQDPANSVVPVDALVGVALRRNPRRAHLLVSTVLAKHVPTPPLLVESAGALLGTLVAEQLGSPAEPGLVADASRQLAEALATPGPARDKLLALRSLLRGAEVVVPDAVALGYAETATGLGRLVADQLGCYYIHSTRRSSPGDRPVGGFDEAHSHATRHQIVPTDEGWLRPGSTLVLVDDELSTGSTIINTIREIHAIAAPRRVVVAALVDLRSETDRARFTELEHELDTVIDVVSLGSGAVRIPDGFAAAAAERVAETVETAPVPADERGLARILDAAVVGVLAPDRSGAPYRDRSDGAVARAVADAVEARSRESTPASTLVLGTEEFMAFPLEVAALLDTRRTGVLFSSTTRSPIAAIDRDDYAIRSVHSFPSHDETIDGPGPRFAYNLTPGGRRFEQIVLVPEPGVTRGDLADVLDVLATACDEVVVVTVSAPVDEEGARPLRGPAFGSYRADEVSWLLQDLGSLALEAPSADREAAIQSGRAHYAESLPQEYVPSPEYRALYADALERSARRVALAVGVAAEMVLDGRERPPVLVSLARAGTPIGILMKRWIERSRSIGVDHYTMSIVRGVGIDTTALDWLADHHDPADVVFVDGWTGKGAIARELTAALDVYAAAGGPRFSDDLVVLADPGHCVPVFGTRDDFLIPSACLNSTVSGLVSRTVFSERLIGPGKFHGAKFYSELAADDVSGEFLDTVSEHFAAVHAEAAAAAIDLLAIDRTPTWEGWATVERLQQEYGLDDVNLVKPGVGETTRVLLRRVPWKILVRPDALDEVAHVLLLAEQRGVEVVHVEGLPYSCVGLIRPLASDSLDPAQGAL
ncbi:phosphoribosyltransferase domain-containing protein [Frondihabitans sp. VKM Ac-2883]|uniref:phosphoribosyltransferase domain-containing protein n=1 Tax=Frondihabitans sp. VKM Ac-2883 TaxID=2783823 RepID=UPI00188C6D73|nr:phosphoribosyltransferase domain-containing protein [Frondihabitans sp. VKM Ac-2883]